MCIVTMIRHKKVRPAIPVEIGDNNLARVLYARNRSLKDGRRCQYHAAFLIAGKYVQRKGLIGLEIHFGEHNILPPVAIQVSGCWLRFVITGVFSNPHHELGIAVAGQARSQ